MSLVVGTGSGGGAVLTSGTRETILALMPGKNALAYATDTNEFLLWDLDNSEWRGAQLDLLDYSDVGGPDIGAEDFENKSWHYLQYAISDKRLTAVQITDTDRPPMNGMLRFTYTASGWQLQLYYDETWNVVWSYTYTIDDVLRFDHPWEEQDAYGFSPVAGNTLPDVGAFQRRWILDGGVI